MNIVCKLQFKAVPWTGHESEQCTQSETCLVKWDKSTVELTEWLELSSIRGNNSREPKENTGKW